MSALTVIGRRLAPQPRTAAEASLAAPLAQPRPAVCAQARPAPRRQQTAVARVAAGTGRRSVAAHAAAKTSEAATATGLPLPKGVGEALLRERSPSGQAAREAALNGAVVLFVCAGYGKKRFIYEKARSLGVKAILVDSPNHWGRDCVGDAFDAFYPVDLSRDADTVLADIATIYDGVVKEFGAVHGICSFSDLAQPLVARLCAQLGYPANSVEAVACARNKDLTRLALTAAGVPTPSHMLIQSPSQLEEAAKLVGFPSVLKPVGGSESIGVVRVDNEAQLAECYEQLQAIMRATAYKDGSLSTFEDESDAKGSANAALEFFTDLMLEQYMDGAEVDVDIVMSGGEVVYANVVDNWPTFEPWFQETGTNVPSTLPAAQQEELIEMAKSSLAAMGLTHGIQHTELKYTSRGARLLEVNPRMGGKCVHIENVLSTGVCMVVEQLLASCGLPNAPPAAAEPLNHIGEYSINAPRSGVLGDHEFLEKWVDHPDVVYCRPLAEVGARLRSPQDGFPTWIAEVMVRKPTVQEAITFVKSIHDDICENANILDPEDAMGLPEPAEAAGGETSD
ncbi:ATP-grasp domain containing 1 [Micractinium conductrix]|uniref:ATP-grasp domain containing 1 n=1 Tax=Micractinium conductrix TaxID=554055 RepID=A0A2P6VB52_9CHLO|nr:ATP-grasp domain containing 1 [Micractinium conductrix]|eukprot:PSC71326.1 ATP-grasp domain containing 1 [Micractinium conductrix]